MIFTTYNIQTDVRNRQQQIQDSQVRLQPLFQKIQNLQGGDIINLQEVPPEFVQRLQQLKNNYHLISQQHFEPNGSGRRKNDSLVILIRKDRFDLKGQEEEIGNPNISLIVSVIEQQSQKTITVFNTHVRGGPNRLEGETQVQGLLTKLKSDCVIGSGDFNGELHEKRIQIMLQAGFTIDPSPAGDCDRTCKKS